MKKLIVLLVLLFAVPASAQISGGVVTVRDSSTGAVVVNIGDAANNAMRINCVTGCSGGAVATFGSAIPASGTAAAFSDGTNSQMARVADMDSGAGSVYGQIVTLRRTASGGPVEMIGSSTSANSLPVVIASDQGAFTVNAAQSGTWTVQPGNTANTTSWLVRQERSTSATLANVASSATNVTCLASNAARRGAGFFNESTQPMHLKWGATASLTSYTVRVEGGGYYEMSAAGYSGIVDCIWSSANGNARVTEW